MHHLAIHMCCFAALLFAATPALADTTYETTLNLVTPVSNDSSIDTIVLDWSTNKTSGIVTNADLVDLSMELLSGGSTVYTDTVLIGGVPQPIGGAARTAADIFWDFDLSTLTLEQIRNVLPATISGSAGVQYLVQDSLDIPTDGLIIIQRYVNGTRLNTGRESVASQSTRVPEPGTIVLLGLGALGLALRRRR